LVEDNIDTHNIIYTYAWYYIYHLPCLSVYIKLEINDTLLCSVTLEYLAVGISSLEVVPFLLVLSFSQEHAEMVQLLMIEIHS